MNFSLKKETELFSLFKTSRDGLAPDTAKQRLADVGTNELRVSGRQSLIKKILSPFSSLFVVVLIVGGLISFFTGHRADAIIIGIVIGINAIIEYAQSYSAARVLKALKKYDTRKVKVRRGGEIANIDTRQLVPGDIVLLSEGQQIPADGRLVESNGLEIDESALTGESLPVHKTYEPMTEEVQIFEQKNMTFKGTLVQAGRGEYIVTATGNDTQLGTIAQLSAGLGQRPPIMKKIDRLTYRLVFITLAAAVVTVGLGVLRGETFVDMVRFAIALIVSVIPEGLPVTMTIIFLLGIKRMAQHKAFVRNLQAVETLGMVTAVATDKTGTLTKNQLEIAQLWDLDGEFDSQDHTDVWLSVSHRHPDTHHIIENVITEYAEQFSKPPHWKELDDLPFDTKRRFTVVLWERTDNPQTPYAVYIKGAPETVLEACNLSRNEQQRVLDTIQQYVSAGGRVIAVAKQELNKRPDLTTLGYDNMQFVGLVCFRDELRAEAHDSVMATKRAGIKVFMLTGDHQGTAQAIGQEVGIIDSSEAAAEGEEIADMELGKVNQLLEKVRVFGRILPEHKYKILQALKKREITAMTGDGVNDAPALTQAHVGIAMGSGTDVAKEASDIVLLDDNYATIVKAIEQGRTIYANIRKMVFYLLSTNLAEVFTIMAALAVGLPLPVTAAQVLWLNIVTDTTMVIPLGLEPPESDQMSRPPRRPDESLLSNHMATRLLLTGLVMAGFSLLVFLIFLPRGYAAAQTMTFLILVVVQWANSFNTRSETQSAFKNYLRPNRKLWVGIILGIALQWLVMSGPLKEFMGITSIQPLWMLWVIPAVVLTVATAEIHKWYIRRRA